VRFHRIIGALGLAAVQAACVIDTVPLPEDKTTQMAPASTHVDTGALFYTENPAILVGTTGAVRGLAEVWVLNLDSAAHWQASTEASMDGSFNLPLDAQVGDELEISMHVSGVELASATLLLSPPSNDAAKADADLTNYFGQGIDASAGECTDTLCGTPGVTLVVTSPDPSGIVFVSGPPGSLPVGLMAVVANLTLGPSTTATSFPDGSFTARILGRDGDELALFAVEPAASNAGSTPTTLVVP